MLRGLKVKDMYKMSRILKKIGLKLDMKDKNQSELGAEIMLKIAENLHLAETDVNEFLSDLAGIELEEFEELSIKEVKKLYDEFRNLEGVSDFLSKAGK